ncbi:MAG: PIN domain-containing protein, partial [Rhodospirillales bacterium]|nr:PIN domain-containing protein [Rhodospirillales bacterium]
MSGERFTLDTNVLIYAIDTASPHRHAIAREVVLRAQPLDCCLTLQAVSEFFVAVSRKRLLPIERAARLADDWMTTFETVGTSADAIRQALGATLRHRASYWDALLVAAAAGAGCIAILTEDLADGT